MGGNRDKHVSPQFTDHSYSTQKIQVTRGKKSTTSSNLRQAQQQRCRRVELRLNDSPRILYLLTQKCRG